MRLRPGSLVAALVALASAAAFSGDAHACGGCFPSSQESQSTVVTGHRMAFAISTTQTVLWDQIKYQGSPAGFAWVLPIHGPAVLELATDAFFETLDAATSAQVLSPSYNCGAPSPSQSGCAGGGCGSASIAAFASSGSGVPGDDGAGGPTVTVTHEGTVGPYETVTVHANVPDALPTWLTANGYKLDPSVSPIIDAYTSAGFDFIALKLKPGQGIQQMKPVRVVTAGGSPTLPLRMVAAGTGANVAITLFVIGEGRWEPQNFPSGQLASSGLTWDFTTQSSNYAQARLSLMAEQNGRTWNTAYSAQGVLLASDGVGGQIQVGQSYYSTLADAYIAQGISNGETTTDCCQSALDMLGYTNNTEEVSGLCLGKEADCSGFVGGGAGGGSGAGGSSAGGTGGGSGIGVPCSVPVEETDAVALVCGKLDDMAVALVGMHPADVWLTRLEANLPHAALDQDLTLQAAKQTPVSNIFNVTQSTGNPCATPAGAAAGTTMRRSRIALAGVLLGAVAAAFARRRRRTAVAAARAR